MNDDYYRNSGLQYEEKKSYGLYMKEINSIPLLTEEEERILTKQTREGNEEARDRLISSNLRFVVSVANQYTNKGLSLADLVCEGNTGLIKAVGRFDETKGFKFISYAVWWIRQAIMQALSQKVGVIKLPQNIGYNIRRIYQFVFLYVKEKGHAPSPKTIIKELEFGSDNVRNVLAGVKARYTSSLDMPIGKDKEDKLYDVIPDEKSESTDFVSNMKELRVAIEESMGRLNDKEFEVISLYFGLKNDDPLVLEEVGERFGLTRERIRQIKKKAIKRLRAGVSGCKLSEFYGGRGVVKENKKEEYCSGSDAEEMMQEILETLYPSGQIDLDIVAEVADSIKSCTLTPDELSNSQVEFLLKQESTRKSRNGASKSKKAINSIKPSNIANDGINFPKEKKMDTQMDVIPASEAPSRKGRRWEDAYIGYFRITDTQSFRKLVELGVVASTISSFVVFIDECGKNWKTEIKNHLGSQNCGRFIGTIRECLPDIKLYVNELDALQVEEKKIARIKNGQLAVDMPNLDATEALKKVEQWRDACKIWAQVVINEKYNELKLNNEPIKKTVRSFASYVKFHGESLIEILKEAVGMSTYLQLIMDNRESICEYAAYIDALEFGHQEFIQISTGDKEIPPMPVLESRQAEPQDQQDLLDNVSKPSDNKDASTDNEADKESGASARDDHGDAGSGSEGQAEEFEDEKASDSDIQYGQHEPGKQTKSSQAPAVSGASDVAAMAAQAELGAPAEANGHNYNDSKQGLRVAINEKGFDGAMAMYVVGQGDGSESLAEQFARGISLRRQARQTEEAADNLLGNFVKLIQADPKTVKMIQRLEDNPELRRYLVDPDGATAIAPVDMLLKLYELTSKAYEPETATEEATAVG